MWGTKQLPSAKAGQMWGTKLGMELQGRRASPLLYPHAIGRLEFWGTFPAFAAHSNGGRFADLTRESGDGELGVSNPDAALLATNGGGKAEIARGRVEEQQDAFADAVAVAGVPEAVPFADDEGFSGSGAAEGFGDAESDAHGTDVAGGGRHPFHTFHGALEDDAGIAGELAQIGLFLAGEVRGEEKRQNRNNNNISFHEQIVCLPQYCKLILGAIGENPGAEGAVSQ
jgi:hypothetical protein